MDKPRFDVTPVKLQRMNATMMSSNIGVWDLEVKVTTARHLNVQHKIVETLRDDVLTLANIDADMITQALGYLGNAKLTTGAQPTGLVGGKLELKESTHDVKMDGDEGSLVTTEHIFAGILTVVHDTGGGGGDISIYSMDAVSDAHANGYYSENPGYLRGATAMTWATVFYLESMPTAPFGTVALVSHGDVSSGNSLYYFVNQTSFQFRLKDGTGSIWGTPTKTWVAGDVGKYHTAVATYSANVLRLYINGVEVSTGNTTDGGISQDTITQGLGFLRRYSGGDVNPFYWLVGFAASESIALSATQVGVWNTLCRTQFACAAFTGSEYIWNARDIPNVESTWIGQQGGENMLKEATAVETAVNVVPSTSVTWGT